MRESFAWFLGANRLGVSVYDSATAGCRDGLGASALNLNQGAESTVSFLLALIEMLELAGEGLEYGDEAPAALDGDTDNRWSDAPPTDCCTTRAGSSPSPTSRARRSPRTPATGPTC